MKLNEILLIGGALAAALVLSKNRGFSSINTIVSDTSNSFLPYYKEIDKQQNLAVKKQESNIATLENIRDSNSVIAQNILGYEKNLSQLEISQIQNEIGKTQSFISQQQKVKAGSLFGLTNFSASGLLGKFDRAYDYYSKVWTGEKGPLSGVSIFPDKKLLLTESNRALIQQQAKYEEAQQNIAKANELVFRQQGEIDRLQEEYQTRYGNLSRYG